MPMQASIQLRIAKNSFWIALLLHCLFLLSVIIVLTPKTDKQYVPNYVPSYTASNYVPSYQSASSNAPTQTERHQSKFSQTTRDALLNESNWGTEKTLLSSSKNMIQQNQAQETMNDLKHIEPMLMVGDSSQASDPFMQLLGRALSAHFKYPKMEDAFRVTGRVVLSMVLHPEGNFTNVHVIESSNNADFDNAALYAVNAAPRVEGAERFLKEPKYLVIGFFFGADPRNQ